MSETPDPAEEIAYAKFKKFQDRYNAERHKEESQRLAKEESDRKAKEEADRKKEEESDASLGYLGIGR